MNNAIYEELGERWYSASDDPVALLRAECRLRNPWIESVIKQQLGAGERLVLDVGCGGGFLSNYLANRGHKVTGVDVSLSSLKVAEGHDTSQSVEYRFADAYALPFQDESFDAVCAMDFLEHVEDPSRVLQEASRVLRPGGLFFYYTFNRTPLSWLVAVKGVEVFVRNTPRNLHVFRLFIKPQELLEMLSGCRLQNKEMKGVRPTVDSAFLKLLLTGNVPSDFTFRFCRSLSTGYIGFAVKALQ